MPPAPKPVAVWAGLECTVNRVGNRYFDQSVRNGHATREADFARFAELGVERIRYPFLWETAAREAGGRPEWGTFDDRIERLRRHGLTPIAGLLHHGSGPRDTSLLDPEFPRKFAEYAGAFAERYPDVVDYTPVNEPLTTARFSALYGFWYPHAREDRAFVRALFNQIKATQLAMRRIRAVNPTARLVQTEDLGRASGTPPVAYQVEFENRRRWLTFDLLAGRVDRSHPLYPYLTRHGLADAELAELAASPCPPDVVGVNHYLLSNRFLDHRRALYPPAFHGGNGKHFYADVGAVDAADAPQIGPREILAEAWARYRIPVAVTEVHVRGGRETQLRWFREVWEAARDLGASGADVRAVTAWSLLGSYDWASLCTREEGFYEPGVFDVRAASPRPTALARYVGALATGREFDHPVLAEPGWWRGPRRARYGVPAPAERGGESSELPPVAKGRPLLVTGASGTLGRAFARICRYRGIPYRLTSRRELDIADPASVGAALARWEPWAVVNAAGYVRVDEAERDPARCFRENVEGPALLARRCADRGVHLVCFSSDLVFGGEKSRPYTESDSVRPMGVYGESKAELERRVGEIHPGALLVRSSAFFGPWDPHHFVAWIRREIEREGKARAVADAVVSPTYVPDLVDACLDLAIDGAGGIVHLAGDGAYTWYDFAKLAARAGGWDEERVIATPAREMGFLAPRPGFSALASERYGGMPKTEDALGRYFREAIGV